MRKLFNGKKRKPKEGGSYKFSDLSFPSTQSYFDILHSFIYIFFFKFIFCAIDACIFKI